MKKFPLRLLVLLLCVASPAGAVILFDTADPSVNTTAPGGALLNSGWQYQGDWGSFLGTPIGPKFFISAAHFGQAAGVLNYQGVDYGVVRSFSLPGSDFLIWEVAGSFPDFAPVYTDRDELGKHLLVMGRGTLRGGERFLNDTLRGWDWAPGNTAGVRRWGENDVSSVVPYQGHDLLYATFDQHVVPNDHPNEAHLSSGDSGGAVFLQDPAGWKLAGINFAVDDLYAAPSSGSEFTAAVFDARGFYTTAPNDPSMFVEISDPNPVPTGFYASRISSELAWIGSVIADPQIGYEPNQVTLTYWRFDAPLTDIVYEVQQSSDLVSWSAATTQGELLTTAGDLQQTKAKVNPGSADHLFLRLKVSRP
jgi:hypothetical protein